LPLNNGEEEKKEMPLTSQTYSVLKASEFEFRGQYRRAKFSPKGMADVVVTDGFTGMSC